MTASSQSADPLAPLLGEPDPVVRYEALKSAQDAYEDLARRIAAERARAVSEMHQAGLSYGRIAEVLGFTRARAQQLVERADPTPRTRKEGWQRVMATQDQLVEYLTSFVGAWPRAMPLSFGHRPPASIADTHTAEQIANELVADPTFRSIHFGTWLSSPQGQVVAAAVKAVAPPLVARDVELLVAALNLAIKIERDRRSKDLAGKLVLGAVVALVAYAARGQAQAG